MRMELEMNPRRTTRATEMKLRMALKEKLNYIPLDNSDFEVMVLYYHQ